MKIAIDQSPLVSSQHLQHRVRGVGYYLKNLKTGLLQNFKEDEFVFFTNASSIPKDISAIHYPYFEPFFLTLPLKKTAPTVVTVHDLTPLVFPKYFPVGIKGKIKWEIQKWNLRRMDRVIADSEASKVDIIRFTNIPKDRIDVVYLAASDNFRVISDTNYLNDVRKRYNLPETFLLYVGDVTWNKNLPRLLRAVQSIQVPLVLVGKALVDKSADLTNPWNQDLASVLNIVKDDPMFIRLGFVPDEDLPALYNLATVFTIPSLYEGFGLPLVEAMSCGVPVLTTREGSIPEVVNDAAEFVNAYDTAHIANGISALLKNEKGRKVLSSKGLERVKMFSWKKTAQQTFDVYKKIAGK